MQKRLDTYMSDCHVRYWQQVTNVIQIHILQSLLCLPRIHPPRIITYRDALHRDSNTLVHEGEK
jgi:hypothetical protein